MVLNHITNRSLIYLITFNYLFTVKVSLYYLWQQGYIIKSVKINSMFYQAGMCVCVCFMHEQS